MLLTERCNYVSTTFGRAHYLRHATMKPAQCRYRQVHHNFAVTGFPNFTFTFTSVDYWTIYDKMSRIFSQSLPKFNQLFAGPYSPNCMKINSWFFKPHRGTTQMRSIATDRIAWSVGRSVCHSREPCRNDWTDRDFTWVVDSDRPKEQCIKWVQIPIYQFWRGKAAAHWSLCRLPRAVQNGWTDRDAVWDVDSSGPKQALLDGNAHWRHLVNMTEPSMHGGDAALRQLLSPLVGSSC